DLTQEVFLRLWHRAAQWKREAPLESWLRRIGTNLALNHLRTIRRRRVKATKRRVRKSKFLRG
ncbi:MAG: sigma factor, partial [Candidatus Latescibacteria bacterium]|nr:sigma factor [Candidatus Latescibacterota bacterium]